MANTHETLTGLFTDIADAIRVKTGSADAIVADEFPAEISAIDTQENLDPELSTQNDLITRITAALEGKLAPPICGYIVLDEKLSSSARSITIEPAKGKNNLVWTYRQNPDKEDCYERTITSGESSGRLSSIIVIDGVCISAAYCYKATTNYPTWKDYRDTITWDSENGILTSANSFVDGDGSGAGDLFDFVYITW